MTALVSSAHCAGCGWTTSGTPADVDRAADRHTTSGHATTVRAWPKEEK